MSSDDIRTMTELDVYLENVKHGTGARRGNIYATVRDAATGELLIRATLDYCLGAIEERNWVLVPKEATNDQ